MRWVLVGILASAGCNKDAANQTDGGTEACLAVTACEGGDGCCPAGCGPDTDNDSSTTCGNGSVESTETCDPADTCPTSCSDGQACTTDTLIGSSANCNAKCATTPITACANDDGCCASGCTSNNDNDCVP